MTNEETIAYFKECNENLVSVAKDENVYDYEKQVIEADCMRGVFEANEKAIQALEQTMWISVNERLPEKDKYKDFYKCLVAIKYTSKHDICDTVTAYFDGKHFYSHPHDRCFIEGVKAWQPLPKSFKAESEE